MLWTILRQKEINASFESRKNEELRILVQNG